MQHSVVVAALCAVFVSGCVTSPKLGLMEHSAAATEASISIAWQLENRYRLIASQVEEERFRKHLSAYAEEYKTWFANERYAGPFPNVLGSDLLYTNRIPFLSRGKARGPGDNFATNYDTRTTSYRCRRSENIARPRWDDGCVPVGQGEASWIQDPRRIARISVAKWSGQECEWIVGDAPRRTAPCTDFRAPILIDVHTPVTARVVGSGETLTSEIYARDLKIVALGDSFSAGEGNPHSQWRLFSLKRRPAYWLDPRCHRSLLSGPSLASAYIAYNNPHTSVTLLHYGCSGASVADGVALPWAHLESSKGIDRQWRGFEKVWQVHRPADQMTAALANGVKSPTREQQPQQPVEPNLDYPRSQIEQARADLGGVRPDAVFVTVGGNDVGFADIVKGLAAHKWTPDLHPTRIKADVGSEALNDQRLAATLDEAAWIEVARATSPNECGTVLATKPGPERDTAKLKCAIALVKRRIGEDAASATTLRGRYQILAKSLEELEPQQSEQVFITTYPNFVRRWKNDRKPGSTQGNLVECEDRSLDGRPGLVPGFITAISSAGVRAGHAREVDDLTNPLNSAIVGIAGQEKWTVVSQHTKDGEGNGYCSIQRWYNTYVDSLWNQGNKRLAARPLGNFRVSDNSGLVSDGVELPAGQAVVWNAPAGCFLKLDTTGSPVGGCVRYPDGTDPVFYGMTRKKAKGVNRIAAPKIEGGGYLEEAASLIVTTGPVHPNLFGHCNYAAALATAIGSSEGLADKLSASWRDGKDRDRPVKVTDVCAASAWGYQGSR